MYDAEILAVVNEQKSSEPTSEDETEQALKTYVRKILADWGWEPKCG
jgi:hypothetical protein